MLSHSRQKSRPRAERKKGSSLYRITAEEFARRLKRTSEESDKRFAFFLGAGCSVSSGIPAAGSLVRKHWLPRLLKLRAPNRQDLATWAKEEFPDYDQDNPAAAYGAVIDALFLQVAEERQREIESLCNSRFPGFGYSVLAHLVALEGGPFNVVLTTNFDDLVADALYLFTQARPLVILHESLANYIRPTRTRPLVVKLHGDHRLSPQNTTQETAQLRGNIEERIRRILSDRGLIFIGYGGNDQGIASVLGSLSPEALPLGVFWVSGSEPNNALTHWLETRKAVWVEKGDFDELMLLIKDAFGIPHPDLRPITDVFNNCTKTYDTLSKRINSLADNVPDAPAMKQAIRHAGPMMKWVFGGCPVHGAFPASGEPPYTCPVTGCDYIKE